MLRQFRQVAAGKCRDDREIRVDDREIRVGDREIRVGDVSLFPAGAPS